jgi:[ribosomal protein S5]-alanine N-acetyltransferase
MKGPEREPMMLTTPHLCVRPVAEEDAEPTAALVTPDVADNLLTWPSPMSAGQALARIRECATLQEERRAVNFAILLRDRGQLIGWVGLKLGDDGPPRLGYWIGTAFRNAGLMKEAARCAVPAGAAFLGASSVDALVLPENAASIAVLKHAGFTLLPGTGLDFEMARGLRHSERYRWESPPRS